MVSCQSMQTTTLDELTWTTLETKLGWCCNVAVQYQRPPLADLGLVQAKAAHGCGVQGRSLSFALRAVAAVLRDQAEASLGTVDQQVLAPQFLAEEVLRA